MGYTSTMNECNFVSDKTVDEVQQMIDDKIEEGKVKDDPLHRNYSYLDIYHIEDFGKVNDKLRVLSLMCEDWTNKHYGDGELSLIIKEAIAPGYYTILSFTGEDGNAWGYFITKEFINEINYEVIVMNEQGNLNLKEIEKKFNLKPSERP